MVGQNGAIGWDQWGKPDKATCSWLVARMADDMRLPLNKSTREVLEWVLFFAWKSSSGSGGTRSSIFFSQEFVAKSIGKSRWTIARALESLASTELIKCKMRLKTKEGKWRPRLVTLAGRLLSFLSFLSGKAAPSHRGAKLLHNNIPNSIKVSGGGASLSESAPQKEKDDYATCPPSTLTQLFNRFRAQRAVQ